MTSFQNICVYCASSGAVDAKYLTVARDVGQSIAKSGKGLVYGGSHVGLMGAAADAALAADGDVIGVIPQHLKDREVAHIGLTELHTTHTLQERQQRMADLSDAFVVLPGGLGTLAEFFEVVTWKQLGLHDKPIFVLNSYGYWDSLLKMLDEARQGKFLYDRPDALFEVLENANEFVKRI